MYNPTGNIANQDTRLLLFNTNTFSFYINISEDNSSAHLFEWKHSKNYDIFFHFK